MHAAVTLLHRWRAAAARHSRLADVALTALVLVLTLAPLLGPRPVPAWGWPLVVVECLPLLWWRTRPFPAGLAVGAVTVTHSLLPLPEPVLPWASLLTVVAISAYGTRRAALTTAGLIAVLVPAALLLDPAPAGVEAFVASGVVYALAWLLGDTARRRRERAVLLEQQAVEAERARMAREMHDVVAHHVSLIIVQAEAGPALLERSPAAAVRAFDAIGDAGRQALDELREVLGTLRGWPAGAGREPVQGVAALPDLLAGVRRAGVTVEQVVTGPVVSLPAPGDRAVFRIVQEALTNVVKHAGEPAVTVTLHYTGDAVSVAVRDHGASRPTVPARAAHSTGNGLVGMRERVTSLGGRFSAGPAPGGGWLVTAVLPVRSRPA